MKQNKLVETVNVTEARKLIINFLKRTKTEQRGIALIYGDPGLGKTRLGERMAFSDPNWLYLRLRSQVTRKSFLQDVYARVTSKVYGAPQVLRGTLAEIENAIMDLLEQNPEIVMVIDEVNLAIQFHKWDILELIRDFADLSFASFILIGEHDTKNAIERYNKHFFDRCQFFYQFKKNGVEDVARVLNEVSDIQFNSDMAAYLHKETDGNLRKLGKSVELLEHHSRGRGKTSVSISDFKG